MSIKSLIWEELEKTGYMSDSKLAKIYGKEPNFYTASLYIAEYYRIKTDREHFADKEIVGLHHYRKIYSAQLKGEKGWTKISKQYFNEIKSQFKKDTSRPDLKEIENYIK
jgi:hypothetical protein